MASPYVPRNFRVSVPAWLDANEDVIFATLPEALAYAREWSLEDRVLVLVWDFAAAMYVARYDGRPIPHPSSWVVGA